MKIHVEYVIEISDKHKQKLIEQAEEEGYTYNDAGPVESIKRMLIYEGVALTLPDEKYHDEYTLTRITGKQT